MDQIEMGKLLGMLRTIAEALLNMEKNLVGCFGPDGSVARQLKAIEEQLKAINANLKK